MEKWPLLDNIPPPFCFEGEALLAAHGVVGGVYLLWDLGGNLVYVGQSFDIANRLSQHRKEGTKEFHRATWIAVADKALRLRYEGILILASCPPYNRSIQLGLASDGRVWDSTRLAFGSGNKARKPKSRASKISGNRPKAPNRTSSKARLGVRP